MQKNNISLSSAGKAQHSCRDRLRILLVLTEYPPKIGGMQTHALYLSRHLYERGYALEVATYHPEDREEEEAVLGFDPSLPFPVHRVLSRIGFWRNLKVLSLMGERFRPDLVYSSTVFYGFLQSTLGVPVLSRSVGNDILRPWIAYPFRPGSGIIGHPRVERLIYNFFKRMDKPEWIDRIFRNRRQALMERSVRQMTRVLANSEFTATLLRDIGLASGSIDVVVGGVEYQRFQGPDGQGRTCRGRLGLPEGRFLIATVCRLVEKKGIDFLLTSIASLRQRMPDVHLVIVGDGPHDERCRRLTEVLGLNGSVTFAGRVPHERIHEYYWCSDLFVLASREFVHPSLGLRDAETMGRVLCEANAAGLPVIASRSGGIPSVIAHGKNGLLFEPGNMPDLLRQITRLRTQPGLAGRMIRAGRETARKRFDWTVILGEHERIFHEVLAGKE